MKTRQCVSVIHTFWVMHATPYDGQTCRSTVFLEAPLCSLFYEATNGSG